MVVTVKKVTRIAFYSMLLGIVSFFGFLFSKNKREYHVSIKPLDMISSANAESDGGDNGSSGDSGCGSSSDM